MSTKKAIKNPVRLEKNKKLAKSNNQRIITTDDIHGQLQGWAHTGTKEALENIEKFIKNEKDENILIYAEIACDEAEFFYYSPQNKEEERDFLLARKIWRKQENLWKLEGKLDAIRLELAGLKLNKKVHQKLMKNLNDKNKKEGWKYNFSEDYYLMRNNRLVELEDEIEYESTWLETARWMIKIKKYKVMPVHIFDHIHFDSDLYSSWDDELDLPDDKNGINKIGGLHDYISFSIDPADDLDLL